MKDKNYISKEYLINEITIFNSSPNKIAKQLKCSVGVVKKYLKMYGILVTFSEPKATDSKTESKWNYNPERHKKYYCKELNCKNEITYQTWKRGKGRCSSCKLSIKKRKKSNKKHPHISRKYLVREFIVYGKLVSQIAKQLEQPISVIKKFLKEYNILGIPSETALLFCKKGKDHPNYKEEIHQKYYCIGENCTNEITYQTYRKGKRRCPSCATKARRRADNSNYIDGGSSKQHYCKEKECNNKIHYTTWLNGQSRCKSCARKIILKTLNNSPNKPEKLLIKLLNEVFPEEYKFVGNGELMVGGFCPDFVNKDNNKIIEHYGDYWHNLPDWKKRDKRRIKTYKNHGYKTLIIWEHELKDLNKVEKKIIKFNDKK